MLAFQVFLVSASLRKGKGGGKMRVSSPLGESPQVRNLSLSHTYRSSADESISPLRYIRRLLKVLLETRRCLAPSVSSQSLHWGASFYLFRRRARNGTMASFPRNIFIAFSSFRRQLALEWMASSLCSTVAACKDQTGCCFWWLCSNLYLNS